MKESIWELSWLSPHGKHFARETCVGGLQRYHRGGTNASPQQLSLGKILQFHGGQENWIHVPAHTHLTHPPGLCCHCCRAE